MGKRVLIALEDEYRAYREVLAVGFETLRPCTQVVTTELAGIGEAIARFDPQVVICSRPRSAEQSDGRAWIELSTDPTRPTKVSVGGRHFEQINPTLEALLNIVDETEHGASDEDESCARSLR